MPKEQDYEGPREKGGQTGNVMWKPNRIEAQQAGNGPLSSHPIKPKPGLLGTPDFTERAVTDLRSGSTRSVQMSSNNFLPCGFRRHFRNLADAYPAPGAARTASPGEPGKAR